MYGNPSLSIYEALRFVNTLKGSKPGEEKEYEKDLGSNAKRILKGFTDGPLRYLWHMPYRGPDSQNGGELIVEAGQFWLFVSVPPPSKLMEPQTDAALSSTAWSTRPTIWSSRIWSRSLEGSTRPLL